MDNLEISSFHGWLIPSVTTSKLAIRMSLITRLKLFIHPSVSHNPFSSRAQDWFFKGHMPDRALFNFYPSFFNEAEQLVLLNASLKKLRTEYIDLVSVADHTGVLRLGVMSRADWAHSTTFTSGTSTQVFRSWCNLWTILCSNGRCFTSELAIHQRGLLHKRMRTRDSTAWGNSACIKVDGALRSETLREMWVLSRRVPYFELCSWLVRQTSLS